MFSFDVKWNCMRPNLNLMCSQWGEKIVVRMIKSELDLLDKRQTPGPLNILSEPALYDLYRFEDYWEGGL